jgi:hypothetical protein
MFKRIVLTAICAAALGVAGFATPSRAQVWGGYYYGTPNTVYYAPNYGYGYTYGPTTYTYPMAPRYYYQPRYYNAAPVYYPPTTYVYTYPY